MYSVKIAPSLLAADFSCLADEVARAEEAGADLLHFDVMDGHFVPNLTFGPALIASLRPRTKLFFDVHLMLSRPVKFLKPFRESGADGLTVHAEVCPDPMEVMEAIGELKCLRGLSVNPDYAIENLRGRLGMVDRFLVMSVHAGFGGQKFIDTSLDRIRLARELLDAEGQPGCDLQVDGGITPGNAAQVIAAGANNLVAGTSVFHADDMALAIRTMRGQK